MKREIVIVTAAYGNSVVKARGGQTALLSVIADAKADGVEIRRELFSAGELDSLPTLAEKIQNHALFAVYSVPFPLFSPGGKLNPDAPQYFEEARILNARTVKFSLGEFEPGQDLTPLKVVLASSPVKLVVENDQSPDCGILSRINAFMFAAESLHLPLSMTFDMANWLWVGQDPAVAAERLARHVGYVHVKAAQKRSGKWHAVALDDSDGSWEPLLKILPQDVPRGIEFPLEGDDLTAVTRYYVELLRQ
ncbi:sugar phosphate isomerase/epimerase [Rahnella aquatilis]|nr:sugar phosphate isomerase/epimerase [Rahnella aquatilis]